jgi:arylsulfatase A-like enzyme
VPSLSSIFSGKYYSELVWEAQSKGGEVWPGKDPTIRFPTLLGEHGVHTVTVASKSWLLSSRRVVAGFVEEYDLDQRRARRTDHVKSKELLGRVREVLSAPLKGPTFLYAHFMDPHTPYDSGKKKTGSSKEKYKSEIERIDRELSEFMRWLDKKGLSSRVVLMLSADHGEAFGEHGATFHAKNVYDELIRVPLWIRVPGVKAHNEKTPVSLIDLGPTVLDLFGVPTPGHFMGQSLTPLLRNGKAQLSRPIVAETRLKQTLVFPDGFKAIRDQQSGAREVYDLNRDPQESKNIIDRADPKYQNMLDAFFLVHMNPMYPKHAPYRP